MPLKIFLSSMTVAILSHLHRIFPDRLINVLRSFGVRTPDEDSFFDGSLPNIGELMLDCGTYSLHFAKSINDEKVSIEEYIQWLRPRIHCVDYYSNFDRNFTLQGFDENLSTLEKMESEGLKEAFPVMHDFHNKEIPFYLNRGHNFLALGSIMEKGSKKKHRTKAYIRYALSRIPTDDVKTHLFGASSFRMISDMPLYSCDSSSWALNNKYGFVLIWNVWNKQNTREDKTEKVFFIDRMGDYYRIDRKYWECHPNKVDFEKYIESLGFTYYDLIGHEAHHYRQLLNAVYYLTIEEEITKKRQQANHLIA